MSSIDQQFVEYVVKSLVSNPEAVVIERRIDEKGVLLELTVDPEDLGRVIGKRGATAQSLRTLLRALGTKNEARYNLKIVDNGVSGHQRDDTATDAPGTPPSDRPAAVVAPATSNATTGTHQDDAAAEPVTAREETSDRVLQTRQELADLDDLDL
ncbi:MAG: KH domain-containing protein [Patescibacteria group bacterium]|nr:KH domain-containing protein [Patescibacteria group bacterium]